MLIGECNPLMYTCWHEEKCVHHLCPPELNTWPSSGVWWILAVDWILWQTLNSRYWSREGLQPCVEYWDWKQSHSLTEHTVLYFLLIVCDVWFLVIFRLFIFKWILKSCSSDVLRVFTDRFFVFRNRKAYALLVESNTAVHSTLFQYMLSRYTHYLMCFVFKMRCENIYKCLSTDQVNMFIWI